MLSDHCLSVTLVYCGQMAGQINMPLGVEVGLGPDDIALDGTQPPPLSAHVYCGQMAGWIKMSVGMEIGLDPGDFVLGGDPAPPPKKGHSTPTFWPCLLLSNGWMGQDATWYEGSPRPRPHCVRWGPSSPQKGVQPPVFSWCLLWPYGRLPISATAEHLFEICKQTDMLITILCTPAGSKVMTWMSV